MSPRGNRLALCAGACAGIFRIAAAVGRIRAHAPARVRADHGDQRAAGSHGDRVRAERARVRGREERDREDVRQHLGHHPHGLRRPAHAGPQLLRPRAARRSRSTPTSRPSRTCTSSTCTTPRSAARRPAGAPRARPSDPCPDEHAATAASVSGRIARLQANGEFMTGPETVLVEDFCEQFTTDTGGGLEFGADGYLYMSAGDGAASHAWDWGQFGNPANPCGDPPGGVGATLAPPTAEGGRLRAQDLRTAGDPSACAGSLIRIDPATGAGVPGNPRFSSADPNERRILAYGLRNPYGLAIRPGTNDVWIADRGHGYWSELDRVPNPTDPVRNFGWPCYEGALDENGDPYPRIRPRSDDLDLDICENLYAEGTATAAPVLGLRPRAAGRAGRGLPRRTRRARRSTPLSAGSSSTRRPAAPSRPPTAARCSSATAGATASGRCCPAPDGLPRAGQRGDVRAARGVAARPRGGPRRRPVLRRQRDRDA